MTSLEHLSTAELVSKLDPFFNKVLNIPETMRLYSIIEEILRRLNEPWRKQKE